MRYLYLNFYNGNPDKSRDNFTKYLICKRKKKKKWNFELTANV